MWLIKAPNASQLRALANGRPDKAFTPPSGNLLQAAGWRFAYPAYR
ncbi:hypothetical protein CIT292_07814 [Citrobacter youngae ATCC 29220]|uniref:Uncharacterized protein n=1 Tax=Citrobacter youngae ATCC 29220 TaxID=500640 RepID=D4BBM5_9ENTR|nr:hypothetical protein CIT292_07814 [Citrobacter youngae ATCC 29220]